MLFFNVLKYDSRSKATDRYKVAMCNINHKVTDIKFKVTQEIDYLSSGGFSGCGGVSASMFFLCSSKNSLSICSIYSVFRLLFACKLVVK